VDLTAEDFFEADFFEALCQNIIGRGTSSRELVALEFDPESGEISVIGRTAPLAAGYPALRTVLKYIGKCAWPMESACTNCDELLSSRGR
jgi:hypothetical protein